MGTELDVLAKQYGVPAIELGDYEIDAKIIQLVPRHIAERLQVIPVNVDQGHLIVAMANPNDLKAVEELKAMTGFAVEVIVTPAQSLRKAIDSYYEEIELH